MMEEEAHASLQHGLQRVVIATLEERMLKHQVIHHCANRLTVSRAKDAIPTECGAQITQSMSHNKKISWDRQNRAWAQMCTETMRRLCKVEKLRRVLLRHLEHLDAHVIARCGRILHSD